MRLRRLQLLTILLSASTLLCGCASVLSKPAYPEQRRFRLAAAPPGEQEKAAPTGALLKVARFTASESFQKTEFVYRTGESSWEPDFYNGFLVPPAIAVMEEARAYFAASEALGAVLPPASSLTPMYALEGHVRSVYGDWRDRAAPKAVLRIELWLVDLRATAPQVMLHRAYAEEVPIGLAEGAPGSRGEALCSGWDDALNRVLKDFAETAAPLTRSAKAAAGP